MLLGVLGSDSRLVDNPITTVQNGTMIVLTKLGINSFGL